MRTGVFLLAVGLMSGGWAQAQSPEFYRVSVTDVTQEYTHEISPASTPTPQPLPGTKPGANDNRGGNPYSTNGGYPPPNTGGYPAPTNGGYYPNTSGSPNPAPPVDPLPPLPGGTTGGYPYPTTTPPPPNQVTINDLITLGSKVWDFIISNKPNATYAPYRASVVPSGISHWTQLRGWSKPVSRVFRVSFQNMFGMASGSFDYRITFIYGGTYQNKGKYIGQISVVPANVRLATDRSLDVKVEILEPLNFGTEDNPIAGVTLQVSWSSPTTVRYQMNSAELFLYGTGEIQNLTDGN